MSRYRVVVVDRDHLVFLLSRRPGTSDWVKNLEAEPNVRIGLKPISRMTASALAGSAEVRACCQRSLEQHRSSTVMSYRAVAGRVDPGSSQEMWLRHAFRDKYERIETYRPRGESLTDWIDGGMAFTLDLDPGLDRETQATVVGTPSGEETQ